MGLISGDSKGIAISMDLLLALIPLTIAIGIIGADMDNMLYLIQDTVYRASTDRVAVDTVNALLQTSGEPAKWEKTGNATIPGLARFDDAKGVPIEGTISAAKLAALKESHIQNMVGDQYGFYLEIVGEDLFSPTTLKTLGSYNSSANDIVKIERIALYSKLDVLCSIVGQIRGAGTNKTYTPSPDRFETSYYYNQTYDYWIFVVNNGYTTVDVTFNGVDTITLNSTTINQPVKINPAFLKMNVTNPAVLYNNTVSINTGSARGNSMDLYIVQVPKGTGSGEINYNNVKMKGYRFQFYLWTK